METGLGIEPSGNPFGMPGGFAAREEPSPFYRPLEGGKLPSLDGMVPYKFLLLTCR